MDGIALLREYRYFAVSCWDGYFFFDRGWKIARLAWIFHDSSTPFILLRTFPERVLPI